MLEQSTNISNIINWNYILVAGFFFLLGLLTGFFMGANATKKTTKEFEGSQFVLIVVTCLWASSVVYDMANPEYSTPAMIHTLMGMITGFFYRNVFLNKGEKKNE